MHLPNRWNFSKFKIPTWCKAIPRSMFWLQCIPSKTCLLFLPLLRLFCLLESGVPRESKGWWEQKQTRCLCKHSLFFWPSRDPLGNGKACSASWENCSKRNFQLGIIFGNCSDFSKPIFFPPNGTGLKKSKDYLENRGNATLSPCVL